MNTRSQGTSRVGLPPVVAFLVLAGSTLLSGCLEDDWPADPGSEQDGPPAVVTMSQVVGSNTLDAAGSYTAETYFTLTNRSSEGVYIKEVIIDLTSAKADALFDTQAGPPGAFFQLPFLTDQGYVVGLTGWVGTVDGDGDVTDPYYTVLGMNRVEDGAKYLHISFADFEPGEWFTFRIDVDQRANGSYSEFCLAKCFKRSGITIVFVGPDMLPTPVYDRYEKGSWRSANF